MTLNDIILLVKAGYTKTEIDDLSEDTVDKQDDKPDDKPDDKQDDKPDDKQDDKPDDKQDDKPDDKPVEFNYTKLASALLSQVQSENRRKNVEAKQANVFEELNKLL